MRENIEYSSRQQLEQTSSLLSYRFENIRYISRQLFNNSSVKEILVRDADLPLSPELLGDMNTLYGILINHFYAPDMYKMILYIDNDIFYSHYEPPTKGDVPTMFSSMAALCDEPWYEELISGNGTPMWLPPSYNKQSPALSERVVSYVRTIRSDSNYLENIAVIRIDILESTMNEIVSHAVSTKSGCALLVSGNGDVMAASGEELARACTVENGRLTGINESDYLTYTSELGAADMRLVTLTPKRELRAAANGALRDLLLALLLAVAAAYLLAYLISDSITRRLKALTENMRAVQSGDFSSRAVVPGRDEISELAENYNYMLGRLEEYSQKQYIYGRELKSTELKALRAQINPHFLYNTLELINWKALKGGLTEVSEIVCALAKYYRLTLNKGRETVTLREELEHAAVFVRLYNYRHSSAVALHIDVEPGLEARQTPALILQPLVENAILHGIMEKPEKSGDIWITARSENGRTVLTVRDNGIGMSPERCREILRRDCNGEYSTGYGIKNVNQRIKLFYGDEFGLVYRSPGSGGSEAAVTLGCEPLH